MWFHASVPVRRLVPEWISSCYRAAEFDRRWPAKDSPNRMQHLGIIWSKPVHAVDIHLVGDRPDIPKCQPSLDVRESQAEWTCHTKKNKPGYAEIAQGTPRNSCR